MAKNNNLKDFLTGVANAIRNKKKTTDLIDPQDFEIEIETIQTGTDTSDATATADDIRLDKTAYGADGKMTGTISDYDGSSEPTSGKSLFAQLVDGSISEVTADDLEGAVTINQYAFAFEANLKSITMPSHITTIASNAFSDCTSLSNIIMPNTLRVINDSAFAFTKNLKTVKIPDSVTTFGSSVFSGSGIVSIVIPDNVVTIGPRLLYQCSELNSVTLPSKLASLTEHMFDRCGSLPTVKIPNTVTGIEEGAFYLCSNLISLTIPGNVTSIDRQAFAYCGKDTSSGTIYTILAVTPPTIQSNTFYNAKINKIIVPVGTSAAYKTATNWSALADYIEEATE